MTGRLDGKAALITGAGRGIGASTAELFAGEGASVTVVDVDADAAEALAARLGKGRAIAACANIADDVAVDGAVEAAIAAFGRLDIVVNNAAARNVATVEEATNESWQRVLSVNVAGTAAVCRRTLPHLRAAGAASVVNVSSAYALVGRRSWVEYDASKAALVALTRSLANEEARHGIRVNAVCPGSTLTPWTFGRAEARGMSEEELRRSGSATSLLGRWADPIEIAYPILWLASDEASFITGAILPVDGGLTAM